MRRVFAKPDDLTPRQWDVALALAQFADTDPSGWARPMDVGGRDANGVGAVLRVLAAKGYATQDVSKSLAGLRHVYLYQPTGRLIAALLPKKKRESKKEGGE